MPNEPTITSTLSRTDDIISTLQFGDNLLDIFMNEFDNVRIVLLKPDKDVVNALGLVFVLFFVISRVVLFFKDAEELVTINSDHIAVF